LLEYPKINKYLFIVTELILDYLLALKQLIQKQKFNIILISSYN